MVYDNYKNNKFKRKSLENSCHVSQVELHTYIAIIQN